jgi:hypothetical protein
MVGSVTFVDEENLRRVALFDADSGWSCAGARHVANILNTLFMPGDYSPVAGEYGWNEINDAAEWLGGTASMESVPEPEEGGVY